MGDESFARIVKQRRDDLGLSQARVGELVGRSASTIRNWERGRSTPSDQSDVATLAAVLGLEEHELTELAGFETGPEPGSVESNPTVEEVYASLSFEPDEEDGPDEKEDEEEAYAPLEQSAPTWEDRRDVEEQTWAEPEEEPASPLPTATDDVAGDVPGDVIPPSEESRPDEFEPFDPEPDVAPDRGSGPSHLDRSTDDRLIGGLVVDAGVPPDVAWGEGTRADPFVPTEPDRSPARAAPPTMLETAQPGERSYLEDPTERQRYRLRALLTAAIVVGMVVVLFWSFGRTTDALGAMWGRIIDMLAV